VEIKARDNSLKTLMKKNSMPRKTKPKKGPTLRERAEMLLPASPSEIPHRDLAVLINELQIHQVELEIQNEELRSAQEKLEESRNRYHDLYDFAPVGYFTISPSGAILESNLAGADMLGVVRSRLKGKLFQGFVSPADLNIFQAHRERLLKTSRKDACELRMVQQGRVLFCRMESACARDKQGTPVSIRTALVDITEIREAQEEMQKAKEGFAALAENAKDIISRRDRNLRCTYINSAVEAQLGLPPKAFLGNLLEETVKDGGFRLALTSIFAEVLESAEAKIVEFEHDTPKGWKTFHAVVIPEKNREGAVESILTIARDITSLKEIQKQLENRVRERTADLARANRMLEEQIERRAKYESELKSAADKIIKEVERRRRLSRRLVELLEEDRRNVALTLHDHLGQLLTTLAMDLEMLQSLEEPLEMTTLAKKARPKALEALNFARNISHELRPSALESLGLVPTLISLVETIKDSSRVEIDFFHTAVSENLEKRKALAIFRIVQEALTNILKHAEAQHIFINLISRHGLVHLTIEDDGRGFDVKALEIASRGPLGIDIMKERAVDVGGRLRIESSPGRGTQVMAEVPI
jgi:PAS domain S-box-containing protein